MTFVCWSFATSLTLIEVKRSTTGRLYFAELTVDRNNKVDMIDAKRRNKDIKILTCAFITIA